MQFVLQFKNFRMKIKYKYSNIPFYKKILSLVPKKYQYLFKSS